MCPVHLSPYHPYLRPSYLPLATVDICDTLAKVELRGIWGVDAFDFDEGGIWVGVSLMTRSVYVRMSSIACVVSYLATLVGEMLASVVAFILA